VQIDSLADVISFGAAPAVLVYQWSLHTLGFGGALLSFAFAACGAIRLARFNVLTMTPAGAPPKKPSKYFVGLPIPAAAGVLVALVAANYKLHGTLHQMPAAVVAIVLSLSFFMVSTVKFRSFKDARLSWRTVLLVALACGASVAVTLRFDVSLALVGLATAYVALAIGETFFRISRRGFGAKVDEDEEEVKLPNQK
jgi:CDP-diacylglycerol---serine O-phosphatidyltransferase